MDKQGPPPAAPSYFEAVGDVNPYRPFTNQNDSHPVIVTTAVPVGPGSTHTVCPHCHAEVNTTVRTEPGLIAWLSGGLLCLLGCWLGCCFIPCCIPECLNVHHACPNCKAYLGRYSHFN